MMSPINYLKPNSDRIVTNLNIDELVQNAFQIFCCCRKVRKRKSKIRIHKLFPKTCEKKFKFFMI